MAFRLFDSITDVRPDDAGVIGLSGSHGGLYPAAVASARGLKAAIFNDAGIGFNQAGVAGVLSLDQVGMAAAALDCMSCHIGSAADGLKHGRVSFVNETAAQAGVAVGQSASAALEALETAAEPTGRLEPPQEAMSIVQQKNGSIHLLDSASLADQVPEGGLVVTGSHGALIGGDPKRALKTKAFAAVFSDAGIGKDDIGITRLPALESLGVAAVTVAHSSAAIGDARSIYDTGQISAMNDRAEAMGARIGLSVKAFLVGAMAARMAGQSGMSS